MVFFGDNRFGYFDDESGDVDFGGLADYTTKAFIYLDFYVMFNEFFLYTGKIVPEV